MQKLNNRCSKFLADIYFQAKWVFYNLRYRNLTLAPGVIIKGSLKLEGRVKVNIGDGSRLGKHVIIYGDGELRVGRNVSLNGACIGCETLVTINDDCLISDCYLADSDYHNLEPYLRHAPPGAKVAAPIVIERNVWIGARATIMKGVTVGENSVVGLGCVVRKSIPRNVVAIGNPQQIVKDLDSVNMRLGNLLEERALSVE
jgi:acetyltransferase-like isoleucine patch superfamily enzyme